MSIFTKLKETFKKVFANPDDILRREDGVFNGNRTHIVKQGDTLSHIALHYYGNAMDYDRIFQANRDVLTDPDEIKVGQVLRIPQ